MHSNTLSPSAFFLSDETVAAYRANGFVRVPDLLSRDEAMRFADAAQEVARRHKSLEGSGIFTQLVNVWREDETLRELTLLPRLGQAAETLAGVPLRLWHDQVLIKPPHNQKATEFHQDQPYWPHAGGTHPISAWIALVDVPTERGCMTFLPGSQARTDLGMQNLGSATSLFEIAPELTWNERVTVPLRAGDCTFHHGRCAHMATPNFTDDPRVAHVVIFMDADTVFTGGGHVVTDGLNLPVGEVLDGPLFPRAS